MNKGQVLSHTNATCSIARLANDGVSALMTSSIALAISFSRAVVVLVGCDCPKLKSPDVAGAWMLQIKSIVRRYTVPRAASAAGLKPLLAVVA